MKRPDIEKIKKIIEDNIIVKYHSHPEILALCRYAETMENIIINQLCESRDDTIDYILQKCGR